MSKKEAVATLEEYGVAEMSDDAVYSLMEEDAQNDESEVVHSEIMEALDNR